MKQEIMYHAKTQEEFADLEKKMKQFLADYILVGVSHINVYDLICPEKGTVKITPKKGQKIEQIVQSGRMPLKGRLLKAESEFVIVELNRVNYFIKYASDEQ